MKACPTGGRAHRGIHVCELWRPVPLTDRYKAPLCASYSGWTTMAEVAASLESLPQAGDSMASLGSSAELK